jgi:hypothetical protein
MITVFSALCDFVLEYKAEIASKVIASAAYDGLKRVLDFKGLINRIRKFFKSEKEAEAYVKTICETSVGNPEDPAKDLEHHYEILSGEKPESELINELKDWIKENQNSISSITEMNFSNQQGFNIGVQNAKKNIYNIQGDFNKSPKKKKP